MNFVLPMGILVIFLGYRIFNNLKNKTRDSVLFVLETTRLNDFTLRFFTFLAFLFGFFWATGKGAAELNAFWFFFNIFWVYLLSQKKIVLQKGIGICDIFNSRNYLVEFKEINSFEKQDNKIIIINYLRKDKEFQLKLISKESSILELEKLLNKNIKKKK